MKRLSTTISAALFAVAALFAANDNITIRAQRQPAAQVFAEAMHSSGMNFFYPSGLLDGITVSVNIKDAPLDKALTEIFAGTGIRYKIKGHNVILSRHSTVQPRLTVSGFVREAGTGESLVGVLLTSQGTSAATATNAQGFFSLSLPATTTTVTASYPGFETVTVALPKRRNASLEIEMHPGSRELKEVTVHGSVNRSLAMESASIGALNVSKSAIQATPVIFGEKDVVKTLQLEPGVAAGVEGTAGMYVHGGNTDENLYMLDNIPLYQVNHFGGLFSAFNVEALRNVEFHKSTFPAKYDGRLSSYIDVNTKDGSLSEHHGSVRLGLTSGAFNIDGPIWRDHTSYSVALRRSWYDVLTIPGFAIANAIGDGETKNKLNYAFTDLNAKITHRFSQRSRVYAMFYYGDDYLSVGQTNGDKKPLDEYDKSDNRLRWGNIVAGAGWNYVLSSKIFGELTGAYTRYQARLTSDHIYGTNDEGGSLCNVTTDRIDQRNNINDWIFRLDFDWRPHTSHRLNFGASYTIHSFVPSRTHRLLTTEEITTSVTDETKTYRAGEFNTYFGGDWAIGRMRFNYGLHYSIFSNDGHAHGQLSPRLAFNWRPTDNITVKGGYSRTVQYVHQLIQSSISLPTDQWVPIVDEQKPQTADKISAGVYYNLHNHLTLSIEGYWKWMNNLLEYADEYYLLPPETVWNNRLTPGTGTAKGIDFKVSREFGNITGHIAYSLLWADRRYDHLNGGRKFPARFDNRHKINILLNWKINKKWEISAAWTGMSGNRITLPTQMWNDPVLAPWHYDMTLATDVNNFRLPFYHRLDLSARRNTRNGYWDFSLYNAYCNMNTIAVRLDYSDEYIYGYELIPRFQKIKLIPIIPSVSYTWLF